MSYKTERYGGKSLRMLRGNAPRQDRHLAMFHPLKKEKGPDGPFSIPAATGWLGDHIDGPEPLTVTTFKDTHD